MYDINDIRHIHLEISSLCNARCPLCPRNFHGYPYNDGYEERNLTLEDVETIFKSDFLEHIDTVEINGNFGDMVMNPETIDIVRYFRRHSIDVQISTNGGARNKKFWQELAETGAVVDFCLDGLTDTHKLYRQDTVFETVMNNAKTFMSSGGKANWKMIRFDHNQHQIEECRILSEQLGFMNFKLIESDRNSGVAVDKKGEIVHVLGNPQKIDFKELLESKRNDTVLLEDIPLTKKNISCEVKKSKSIYVTSTGEVYPCCYTGFYPRTYGHGQYYQVVNKQLNDIIKPNNALEKPLKECMEWFDSIEKSWDINEFDKGRLVVCNDYCGQ